MKKAFMLALGFVLALGFSTVATAGGFSKLWFAQASDSPVQLMGEPCPYGTDVWSASPLSHNGEVYVFFTCSDRSVWVKRYIPNTPIRPTKPVMDCSRYSDPTTGVPYVPNKTNDGCVAPWHSTAR